MHVLYVHQNFPAQFGHIARTLVRDHGWRCTFISEREAGVVDGIEKIQYQRRFGATRHTSYFTRTFETATGHTEGVYRALRARPDIKPDLVVAHSGFGSTLFLPELLPTAPIINFFEYYYRPHNSDMDYRPDAVVEEKKLLRSRARNAMILLDLHNCDAAYAPTQFQRSVFPQVHQQRMEVIFDGVDLSVFHRVENPPRVFKDRAIDPGTRIVTYAARGFEMMRGFDIFMKAAKIIYERFPNVLFLIAGTDRICYGGDEEHIGEHKSVRHWVLAQEKYDLSKFLFVGWLPPNELAHMLSLGDAHIYLTVPFVLSWGMMNALSCGAVVVGSDTPPVHEMITHGQNGFLADFFDAEAIAEQTLEILQAPSDYASIRKNAMEFIRKDYSLEAVLPRMLDLYQRTVAKGRNNPWDQPSPERRRLAEQFT